MADPWADAGFKPASTIPTESSVPTSNTWEQAGFVSAGQAPPEPPSWTAAFGARLRAGADMLPSLHEAATAGVPDVLSPIEKTANSGYDMIGDGLKNILAGQSATGSAKVAMGAFNVVGAPLLGPFNAATDWIGDQATKITGNPDFGKKTALLSSFLIPGRATSKMPLIDAGNGELARLVRTPDGKIDAHVVGTFPPKTEDFTNAAAVISGKDGTHPAVVEQKLRTMWEKDGTHPAEAVDAATESPPIARDLSSARADTVALPTRPKTSYLKDLSDRFFRLRGKRQADQLEMNDRIAAISDTVKNGETQQKWYMRGEGDPEAPAMTKAEIDSYNKDFVPFKQEEAELAQWLSDKAKSHPEFTNLLEEFDPTYMHRMVRGKTPQVDRLAGEATSVDPILNTAGGGLLTRTPPSMRGRTYFTMERDDGTRVLVKRLNDGKAAVSADKTYTNAEFKPDEEGKLLNPGTTIEQDGRTWTMKNAWTREIEANTSTRYYQNALANTIDNVMRMRSAKRAIYEIQNLRDSPEWDAYTSRSGADHPDWISPNVPLFANDRMDPYIAHVIEDFFGAKDHNWIEGMFEKANNLAISSLFWTPIPHAMNAGAWWFTERGWSNFTPQGMASLFVNGAKAIRAVRTLNGDYRTFLREGSSLVSGGLHNKDFYASMLQQVGTAIDKHPEGWAGLLAEGTGLPLANRLRQAFYDASSKVLWQASDMFMMQRAFELEAKGLSLRQAIHQAEKVMPAYRLPSDIPALGSGGRTINMLSKSTLFEFGRYHYDIMKGYGNMAKDLAIGSTQERWDAIGKIMALGALQMVVWPAMTAILHEIPNMENLKVPSFGPGRVIEPLIGSLVRAYPDKFPKMVNDYYGDNGTFVNKVRNLLSPSPLMWAVGVLLTNTMPSGRKAVEPGDWRNGRYGAVAGQLAEDATQIGVEPLNEVSQAIKNGDNPEEVIIRNIFGLQDQSAAKEEARQKAFHYQDREARSRARKPPGMIEQWIKEGLDKLGVE